MCLITNNSLIKTVMQRLTTGSETSITVCNSLENHYCLRVVTGSVVSAILRRGRRFSSGQTRDGNEDTVVSSSEDPTVQMMKSREKVGKVELSTNHTNCK